MTGRAFPPSISPMLPHLLLSISLSGAQLIAITGILGGVSLTAVIIIFGLKSSLRRQELWHETARVALEKGQPLPPAPEPLGAEASPPTPANDVRTGLILIACGVGIFLFLGNIISRSFGFAGAIPGLMGVALLLHGLLSRKSRAGGGSPADRS
jgi:hypothetical protein